MKFRFISIYALCASMCLAAAVLFFTFTISRKYQAGSVDAENTFSWVVRQIIDSAQTEGFLSNQFLQDLSEVCQKSRLLTACVLSTSSGTVFVWPDTNASVYYNSTGTPDSYQTSLLHKVFSTTIDIGSDTPVAVTVTGILFALHPEDIFVSSRNAFLAVLSIFLISVIVLLVFSETKKSHSNTLIIKTTKPTCSEQSVPADVVKTVMAKADVEKAEEEAVKNEPLTTEEIRQDTRPSVPKRAEILTDSAQIEQSEEDLTDREHIPIPVDKDGIVNNTVPEGLFSPVTGIGWEQYLEARLNAELERAASSEQDLTLIILTVAGLLHTDLLSRKISRVLTDLFRFKDMVFEFGKDGFAGILQNTNLDQAMRFSDDLYAAIDSLLVEMESNSRIAIGITTRTARLLPANRLIDEAVSASKKAEEEQSLPIVAFRANPDKYRTFISETIR